MHGKGATRQKVKCSIPNRAIGGTSTAEIEIISDKVEVAGRRKGETPTNGKRTEIVPESSVEGGVITPDHPGVLTHPNAGTVENMATMKRSAGKRRVTRSKLTDNSQTTLLTPTTTIVAKCP